MTQRLLASFASTGHEAWVSPVPVLLWVSRPRSRWPGLATARAGPRGMGTEQCLGRGPVPGHAGRVTRYRKQKQGPTAGRGRALPMCPQLRRHWVVAFPLSSELQALSHVHSLFRSVLLNQVARFLQGQDPMVTRDR